MPDALARRMADNQVSMHAAQLARDTEQLAAAITQYAATLNAGQQAGPVAGTAWRIAQDALALAQLAARLDGMRDIAALVPEED